MNKLNIAVIGSGLSAIGSLIAIKKYMPHSNVTIYTHAPTANIKTRHKLLFHKNSPSSKYGIHLVKGMVNNQNGMVLDPIVRAINYSCFGGSSNVWGGACHPLLESEMHFFDPAIVKGIKAVSELFGRDSNFIDHMCCPVSVSIGASFTKTLTLGNRIKKNSYQVLGITNDLMSKYGNLAYCNVKKLVNNGKQIVVESEILDGSVLSSKYDFVVVAGGVVGTTTLLASYFEKSLSLTNSTNEQYIFLAKYKVQFNESTFGPPSILIDSVLGYPAYIQLYPINISALVRSENLFSSSIDAPPNGVMAAYLYIDSRSSAKVKLESNRGDPCKATIVDSTNNNYFDVKKLKDKVKDLGIDMLGIPVRLFPTSSQHIGSSLNNLFNYQHCSESNIVVVDTTAMKHVPLCTIGLTAAANAYTITKDFFV